MKNITKILTVLLALFRMVPVLAQDNRRLETKVADVLSFRHEMESIPRS